MSGVLASWEIVRNTFRPVAAMDASSGFLIAEVERRFPVRIRIGVRQTAWALGSIGSRAVSTRTVAQTGGDDAIGDTRRTE